MGERLFCDRANTSLRAFCAASQIPEDLPGISGTQMSAYTGHVYTNSSRKRDPPTSRFRKPGMGMMIPDSNKRGRGRERERERGWLGHVARSTENPKGWVEIDVIKI